MITELQVDRSNGSSREAKAQERKVRPAGATGLGRVATSHRAMILSANGNVISA